jgi:hypothetical protein
VVFYSWTLDRCSFQKTAICKWPTSWRSTFHFPHFPLLAQLLASSCLILPLEFFQEIAQFQEIFSGFVAGFARDLKQIRNLAHVIELTILMHASKHSCKSFFPAIAEF